MRSLTKCQRKRFWCEGRVQGALLRQLLVYWFVGLSSVLLAVTCFQIAPLSLAGHEAAVSLALRQLGLGLIATAVVLPIVLSSAIRFSNLFCGPMVRIKKTLDDLADGKTPSPINFRKNDFGMDIEQSLNRVISRMGKASSKKQP